MPLNPSLGNNYGSRLGVAFIQFRADARTFARDARQQIQRGLDQVALTLRTRLLNTAMRNAGREAGNAFARAFRRAADVSSTFVKAFANKFVLGAIGIIKTLPQVISLVQQLGTVVVASAASLPFLISTLLIVKSAFNNAFKGVSEAIDAAFDPDPSKLQAALKDLTPSARSFVLEVARIAPELKKAQEGSQEAFFKPMKGAFTALAKSPFFTNVAVAIKGIAGDMGVVAANTLKVVTANAKAGAFEQIFAQSRLTFAALISVLPQVAQSFIDLAVAAGPFITLLSGKLADKIFQFLDKIQASLADGSLAKAFDTTVAVLGDLGALLGSLGSILNSVFGALSAGGQSVIATIGGVTQQFADFLKTAAGMDALRAIADILHLVGSSITSLLTPLLPVVAQLVSALAGPLIDALKILGPPLTRLISALAMVLTPVIKALAPVLDKIVTALADFLAQALVMVADQIYKMLPTIGKLLDALGPAALEIVGAFSDVLSALLPLLPAMLEAITNLIPVIIALLPLFVTGAKVMAFIVEVIAVLAGWFATLLGIVLKFIAANVGKALVAIIEFIKDIPGFVEKVGGAIADFFTKTIPQWFEVIKSKVAEIGGWFAELPGKIGSALASLFTAITSPFVSAFTWLYDFVSNAIGRLVGAIAGIPATVYGFVGRIADAAASIGRAIGNGIASIPGFAADIGARVVARIRGFANDVIYGLNRGIYQLARLLPFNLPYIPYLANGAIVDTPTMAVIGEAGKEVVLPLTRPARARELAQESGLMDILGSGFGSSPPPSVTVYIGNEEITKRVDVRVKQYVDGQARELAFGSRGA